MTFEISETRPAFEGQPWYENRRLKLYDLVVTTLSNRFLWRCPRERLVQLYNDHVSARHLEVGPGSGYYLDHCRFPTPAPRITLLDLNPDPLKFTAGRIGRYRPEVIQTSILEPLPPLAGPPFESIALNYVLHCLPEPPEGKQLVFANLKRVLAPGGVLFGSTVLSHGVAHTPLSRYFNQLYQRQGSFNTQRDSVHMLHQALGEHFDSHWLEIRGSVALFAGHLHGDSR
ncbi:class I SAM-dependent methyltransferase [Crossiella sp. SN42]|uniref:class I SAM-dependent methyltransferase n=1 Tax=Crossiella sp. SN42 TaxID=2944808 RepID=UPI00207CA0B7|nr:class I SAM-dependent methyltransferase [Crossiella sp. SN42]MCO1575094.1 class I SAM-dependent methyltransferase [Crossiella sp. SN42]